MKIITKNITAAFLLAMSSSVLAAMQDEVQHLLQYVENSGCEFERNGTVYDSKQARSHIDRKYDYVKSHVDETEDFIKYAASKSSMSGNKYQVTCNGSKQTSAEWLHSELSKYRANYAAASLK
jgi:hypothetical protein